MRVYGLDLIGKPWPDHNRTVAFAHLGPSFPLHNSGSCAHLQHRYRYLLLATRRARVALPLMNHLSILRLRKTVPIFSLLPVLAMMTSQSSVAHQACFLGTVSELSPSLGLILPFPFRAAHLQYSTVQLPLFLLLSVRLLFPTCNVPRVSIAFYVVWQKYILLVA
jgi:hypothetical protein